MKAKAKHGSDKHKNHDHAHRNPGAVVAMKEDIMQMSSTEQIVLIEQLAEKVTSNAGENVRQIQTLLHLIEMGSTTVMHLAVLTTAEIFKDIIPLYPIDKEQTEKRLQEVISKDERALLNQELMLVDLYERFMRTAFEQKEKLDQLMSKETEELKRKKLKQALLAYERVLCKALAEIAKELYHFNFAKEIVKFVLRFAYKKDETIIKIVEDFLRFFMASDNPSTYSFKLLILEHFSKMFKQRKFVANLDDKIFSALTHIYVEDGKALSKKQNAEDDMDQRIKDMKARKLKGKLSKTGEKQLKQLESDRNRRNARRKRKGLDDPRLQKELKAELAKSEAVIDPVKVTKMAGTIIDNYYYLMFKIVKEYPDTRLFTVAVDGILAMAHKIEAKMLVAIVDALQASQQTMEEIMAEMASKDKGRKGAVKNHPGFIALMNKRLSTIFSTLEMSSKASFLEEMEQKGSMTALYRMLQDIIKYEFSLEHFEELRRVKLIALLEKLFLARRYVSNECLAAFIKLLMRLLVTPLVPDRGFCIAVLNFCYLVTHKHQKLRCLLDEENEGFGLNIYDAHHDDPYACNGLHSTIVEELKTITGRDGEGSVKKIVDRLVKRLPPTPEQLQRKPSRYYADGLQVAFEDDDDTGRRKRADEESDGEDDADDGEDDGQAQGRFKKPQKRPDHRRGDSRGRFSGEDDEEEGQYQRKPYQHGDADEEDEEDGTRSYFERKKKEPKQAHYERKFKKRDDSSQNRSFSNPKKAYKQKGYQRPMKFMSKKEAHRSKGSRR